MKFQWLEDEDEGNSVYFEIRIKIDAMTKDVAVLVTDFAEEDEIEEASLLWGSQIDDLRRIVGG
jgi:hypothetical protein